LRFLAAMGQSLSGHMRSLALWHGATIHHGVARVIARDGEFAFTSCPGV